ncbi:hypothetical protein MRB53_041921 [Persea americana]|nr:hypothetical protein MRB53_041921 [Persea americana]
MSLFFTGILLPRNDIGTVEHRDLDLPRSYMYPSFGAFVTSIEIPGIGKGAVERARDISSLSPPSASQSVVSRLAIRSTPTPRGTDLLQEAIWRMEPD